MLLYTLKLKLQARNLSKDVRLLLDSGSENSYIKADLAEEMGFPVVDEITQQNELFGGIFTKPERKKAYLTSGAAITDTKRRHD